MIGWIIFGVVVLLVIIIGIWAISTYNKLIRLKNNKDEAFSAMDVQMKKRYDLIPNIVETVKGYTKHEKGTLEAVIAARNKAVMVKDPNDKAAVEKELATSLKAFNMVVEQYPELKANTNFLDLQNELKVVEGAIANSRNYYNACVKAYNIAIEVFPSSIIANMKKFEKAQLFVVEDQEERKAVKVQF